MMQILQFLRYIPLQVMNQEHQTINKFVKETHICEEYLFIFIDIFINNLNYILFNNII
jgi:hypothetical protein